jgi:hypothetical protein
VCLIFLDESGHLTPEPFVVAAGILINCDSAYREVERRVRAIVEEEIPARDRPGFAFRAKDLFHGTGYFEKALNSNAEKWPTKRRFSLLLRLAQIPGQLNISVVFGSLDKAKYQRELKARYTIDVRPTRRQREMLVLAEHLIAFLFVEIAAEKRMYQVPLNEIGMLVAEDTDLMKSVVSETRAFLGNPSAIAKAEWDRFGNVPLKRIVATPHFASRSSSAHLQLADVCAFLINGRLRRDPITQSMFEAIEPQICSSVSDFGDSIGLEWRESERRQREPVWIS